MKPLLFFLCSFLCLPGFAQQNDDFYFFDKNWKPTGDKTGAYLIDVKKISDSAWEWDAYHFYGPLVRVETYSSHDGGVRNGPAFYYNEAGVLDSIAHYDHGKKDGDFFRLALFRQFPLRKVKYMYRQDSLVATEDVWENEVSAKAGAKPGKAKAVSVSSAPSREGLDSLNAAVRDGTVRIEASFPGGLVNWQHYLQTNLVYPQRAIQRRISGQMIVGFLLDENGKVSDAIIERSCEFSLDQEALRVVRNSGRWNPAIDQGNRIASWKHQPVSMRLQSDKPLRGMEPGRDY